MEIELQKEQEIRVGAELTYGDMKFKVVSVRPDFQPPAGFEDTVCLIEPIDGSGFRGGIKTPWGMMYSTRIVESSRINAQKEGQS